MSQTTLFDELQQETPAKPSGPVTCLGQTFASDDERRKHFTDELREKLQEPEFRKIEGFPHGSGEDILNLSDPPYYTACPNPWIADFIAEWEAEKIKLNPDRALSGVEEYHREPFAEDVSEGKNDPIYNAHSYHTKVPHKAIMRYILHYTNPGDIVFDGFCGTGMTGVAAQMCGDRNEVMKLGYQVKPNGTILQEEMDEDGKKTWVAFSKLGIRRAVLNDLSPAATFIAYNYNTPVDVVAFEREATRILKEVEAECGWMYETLHVEPASSRLLSSLGFEPCNPFESFNTIHRRDNLPHIQVPGATYFITFRTDNFRVLSEDARKIALNAICHWDNQRWKLFSAVVMPDHVHLIAKPLAKDSQQDAGSTWDISVILHSVKSFSANEINKVEGKTGTPVWQTESYDRIVRDSTELVNELAYLNHNPVKAGLVEPASSRLVEEEEETYPYLYNAPELTVAGWKPAPLSKINYTVWSDVFVCPECAREIVFGEAAVDENSGSVKNEFSCTHCGASLTKRKMDRAWITKYDSAIKETVRHAKQVPVLINYTMGGKRIEKIPDAFDLALIEKIENSEIPYWFPTERMMEGKESRRNDPIGITHIHHFYTKRNLWMLGALLGKTKIVGNHVAKSFCRFLFQQWAVGFSKLNRYSPTHFSQNNRNLSGTLYVGSRISEVSPDYAFGEKLKRLIKAFSGTKKHSFVVATQDTGHIGLNDQSFDYVFIDPPFGSNLNYSELNFLWEGWLKLLTDNKPEAIENSVQGKGASEYRQLMTACFKEAYRVLKPGRWMTVEFSNTKASVWNSIQTALAEAGFIIANVSALDKQQGSFKAVTTPTAVKQDLVISAYKPNGGFEERFQQEAQSEEGV
jgi:DNA modification methylase/REP element-mobilizing transposase RayT